MVALRRIVLAVAVVAVLAPAAHLLEMPNKLAMDGPLWVAIQHQLYRGWGPLIGAPTEIAGLTLSIVLFSRTAGDERRLWRRAFVCYAAMIGLFFAMNAPVNAVVSEWTAAAPPADWTVYRWRWEGGHAAAAILSFLALFTVLRASRYGGDPR